MLGCGFLDDSVGVPMQFSRGPGGDLVQVVSVRPDLRVENPEVRSLEPVCNDACSAKVDEE